MATDPVDPEKLKKAPKPPKAPELPSAKIPGLPKVPEMPQVPATPTTPDLAELASAKVPEAPKVPEVPKIPDLPKAPSGKAPQPPAAPKSAPTPNPPAAEGQPEMPKPPPAKTPKVEPVSQGASEGRLPRHLRLTAGGLPPETFFVRSLEGREAISAPYRFELDLLSSSLDVDFRKMLREPACLQIRHGDILLPIFGVLSSFEQLETEGKTARYRAVLAPRISRLSLSERSRVFLDRSLQEIVEGLLVEHGLAPKEQFEWRSSRGRDKLESVVQFQESDLDFISRWLEREGISYHFEQKELTERIVFVDGEFPALETGTDVPFDSSRKSGRDTIVSILCRQTKRPGKVVLTDYNWQTPTVPLAAEWPKDADEEGVYHGHGEHFRTKEEGEGYARLRWEGFACREKQFFATGNVTRLRAGRTFTLFNHPRKDFNAPYLLVEIHHRSTQAPETGASAFTYENDLITVPTVVPFRPERLAPWPRIQGTVTATVDGAGGGDAAEIDGQGRYKIVLPWDLSGRGGGTASRFVRKAEPFLGAGRGMHFPLPKGTEVRLAFTDGNPDRPYIESALPNPSHPSPVSGGNATQCVIHAVSGNDITLEDSPPQIKIFSPPANTLLSLGTPESGGNIFLGTAGTTVVNTGTNLTITTGGNATIATAGALAMTTGKDFSHRVTGAVQEHCDKTREVKTVGDSTFEVDSSHFLIVTGLYSIDIGKGIVETVQGNVSQDHMSDSKLYVQGTRTIICKTAIEQESPKWSVKSDEVTLNLSNVTITTTARAETVGTAESMIAALEEQIGMRDSTIKKMTEDITNLDSTVKKLTADVKQYTLTAEKYSAKANSSLEITQGGGKLAMKGGNADLKGSKVKVDGSKINMNGSTLVVS